MTLRSRQRAQSPSQESARGARLPVPRVTVLELGSHPGSSRNTDFSEAMLEQSRQRLHPYRDRNVAAGEMAQGARGADCFSAAAPLCSTTGLTCDYSCSCRLLRA
jgi:hypothetical protein